MAKRRRGDDDLWPPEHGWHGSPKWGAGGVPRDLGIICPLCGDPERDDGGGLARFAYPVVCGNHNAGGTLFRCHGRDGACGRVFDLGILALLGLLEGREWVIDPDGVPRWVIIGPGGEWWYRMVEYLAGGALSYREQVRTRARRRDKAREPVDRETKREWREAAKRAGGRR